MFEVLRPRPLLQISLAVMFGAASYPLFGLWPAAAGLVMGLGVAVLHRWWPAVLAVFFLSGWALASLDRPALPAGPLPRLAALEGVAVWTGRTGPGGTQFLLETGNGVRFAVRLPEETDVLAGERLHVEGKVSPLDDPYWLRQRVSAVVSASRVERLAASDTPVPAALRNARRRMERSYETTLPPERAGLLTAMVFGDHSRAPLPTRDAMKRAGVYHILSTSGLHVGLVGVMIAAVLAWLRTPRYVLVPLAMATLFCYARMAGSTPPVMRAAVAVSLYLAAGLLRRQPDALTALGGAGVYQAVVSPAAMLSAGFQLSYVTAAGLIVWTPALLRRLSGSARLRRQLLHWPAASVAVSAVASVFSLPLIAYYFHEVPVYGVIANLLCVPMLAPTLFAAWVGPAFGFVPGWSEMWLGGVAQAGVAWIDGVSRRTADLPWATFWPSAFSPLLLWLYYGALFGAAKEVPREVD